MSYLGFRVYYGDNIVASSQHAKWEDMPSDNVQVVVLFDERTWAGGNYCTLLHSHDYYWKLGEFWGQTNRPVEIPLGAAAKRGKLLDKADWMAVYERAYGDTQWQCC